MRGRLVTEARTGRVLGVILYEGEWSFGARCTTVEPW